MSYKKFEIWQDTRELVIDIHKMSLKNEKLYDNLHKRSETLGKKLNLFIQAIEKR